MRLFTSNPKCFNSAFCLWHWLLLVKNQESLWHQLASNKSATIDCATNWFSPSGYLNVLFNQFRTWCEWNSSLCDFGAFCILMLRAKPWDSLNTPTLSLSLSLSLYCSLSLILSLSLSLSISLSRIILTLSISNFYLRFVFTYLLMTLISEQLLSFPIFFYSFSSRHFMSTHCLIFSTLCKSFFLPYNSKW